MLHHSRTDGQLHTDTVGLQLIINSPLIVRFTSNDHATAICWLKIYLQEILNVRGRVNADKGCHPSGLKSRQRESQGVHSGVFLPDLNSGPPDGE